MKERKAEEQQCLRQQEKERMKRGGDNRSHQVKGKEKKVRGGKGELKWRKMIGRDEAEEEMDEEGGRERDNNEKGEAGEE